MDEEVVLTLPWAWHDDDAVWCGKASTMEVWTASHASGKDGEERLESRRLRRATVELIPGELATGKIEPKASRGAQGHRGNEGHHHRDWRGLT